MYGNNYGKILLNLTVNSVWGCSCTLYDSSLICTVQGKASGTYHPRIMMTVQATATFQQLTQLKKGQQSWMQCWLLKESLLKATHLHLWYDSFNVFNIVLVAKWTVVMLKFISSENFFFFNTYSLTVKFSVTPLHKHLNRVSKPWVNNKDFSSVELWLKIKYCIFSTCILVKSCAILCHSWQKEPKKTDKWIRLSVNRFWDLFISLTHFVCFLICVSAQNVINYTNQSNTQMLI